MSRKLRVAVWLESYNIAAWFYACIAKVVQSRYAEIILMIVGSEGKGESKISKIKRDRKACLLFHFYRHIDRWFSPDLLDAQELKDIRKLLQNVPIIQLDLSDLKNLKTSETEILERIKKYRIDVIVKQELQDDLSGIKDTVKYGIWGYRFGKMSSQPSCVCGFWEVMLKEPVTWSSLVRISADGNTEDVLYSSTSQTDHISIQRNNNRVYWKTLEYIPRVLRELYDLGEYEFYKLIRKRNLHLTCPSDKTRTMPKWYEVIILVGRLYWRYCVKKISLFLCFEQWFILFNLSCEKADKTEIAGYKRLLPPRDRFWADPFVVEKEGAYHIFLEEYVYKENKGHIACLSISKNGEYTKPIKALVANCHLSYPCLFQHKDILYMIPETAEQQVIDLYQCVSFPNRWEKVKTLMSGIKAVDTTILLHNDLWWLFTSFPENEGISNYDEIFVYYSDDLLSREWIPHPKNPVVSDVRSARSAGRIFKSNSHLYRPSQNCSLRYGYSININKITTLTKQEYNEVCVEQIEPDSNCGILATHTVNHIEGITVIDAMRKQTRYPQLSIVPKLRLFTQFC